ncbi:MAG TPA: hypothetical protein VFH91_01835, partial [Pyrinomonadaceae bacterium]|nr:hypothetical protein [Pyrinomonadaceae bacterium]
AIWRYFRSHKTLSFLKEPIAILGKNHLQGAVASARLLSSRIQLPVRAAAFLNFRLFQAHKKPEL